MSVRSLALLIINLFPVCLCAQNITDTSNGNLSVTVSFSLMTPGTSNTPTNSTASFRIRCQNTAGYHLAASATCSFVPSQPADGGRTLDFSDIGVGITAVDTSKSGVIKPRVDTIATGFNYDPGSITATNGLTPYSGMSSGQATIADLADNPNLTILSGPQIAAEEGKGNGTNYITVTMTFAELPQYLTSGTLTAVVTLTISNGT
jgi:hypothetical protein